MIADDDKDRELLIILRELRGKTLIFCKTKSMCDILASKLERVGFPARAIHGDKSQSERHMVLYDFRSGKLPLMVATDIAARGIDVPEIAVVINYDFPNTMEDYVHRVGRTGRAGRRGLAVTLFTPRDSGKSSSLMEVLKETNQKIPPALESGMFPNSVGSGGFSGGGGSGICRDFQAGNCRFGDRCKWSHGSSDGNSGGGSSFGGSSFGGSSFGGSSFGGSSSGGGGFGGGSSFGGSGGAGGTSGEVCRNFQRSGQCQYGTSCRHSHDPNAAPASGGFGGGAKSGEVCRNFQRGSCSYGDNCRHLHEGGSAPAPSNW